MKTTKLENTLLVILIVLCIVVGGFLIGKVNHLFQPPPIPTETIAFVNTTLVFTQTPLVTLAFFSTPIINTHYPTNTPLPLVTKTPMPATATLVIIRKVLGKKNQSQSQQSDCQSSYESEVHNENLQMIESEYQNELDSLKNQLQWDILEGDALLAYQDTHEINQVQADYDSAIASENSWYAGLCK
jgi:hypothetical protein